MPSGARTIPHPAKRRETDNPMVSIIIALILWSSLGIIIKLSGQPPLAMIFFPCVFSLLALAFLLNACRTPVVKPDRNALGIIALLGCMALLNTGSFFYSYQYTSIANAVLTHYTAPGFVALLAPLFLRERLTATIVSAVAVAACGLWLMLGVSPVAFADTVGAGDRDSIGILCGLVSGLAYAFVIIIIRKTAPLIDPLVMTFGQNLVIAILLLPVIGIPSPFFPAGWLFLAIGIIHSTIAPILYIRGMQTVNANRAAILGYFEPVSAIALAAVFLGEAVSFSTAIGGALILASGYLSRKI